MLQQAARKIPLSCPRPATHDCRQVTVDSGGTEQPRCHSVCAMVTKWRLPLATEWICHPKLLWVSEK